MFSLTDLFYVYVLYSYVFTGILFRAILEKKELAPNGSTLLKKKGLNENIFNCLDLVPHNWVFPKSPNICWVPRIHIPSVSGPHMWCGTRWCHQSSYWPKYLQRVAQTPDMNIWKHTWWFQSDRHHHVLLTFERRVQNSLFDLGLLDHVGSRLGEDELPRPRFETIPVIFNHRDAVLQKDRVKHGRFVCLIWCCASSGCILTVLP